MSTNKNNHKKILVIDDDLDILDAIRLILETNDYSVTTSDSGKYIDILFESNAKLPDLIILDIFLSGKDGRVLCKKLKDHRKTQKIPVIMISAHPNAKTHIKSVGAEEFLAKPFEIGNLLNSVKKVLA